MSGWVFFRVAQARLTRELGPEFQEELATIKELSAPLTGPPPRWSQRQHGALDEMTLTRQADICQLREQQLENARLVLEAHENLVSADETNRGKFQDVLVFMKNRVEQG